MAKGSSTTSLVSTGGSNSLRTTVPMWIVEQFGLMPGHKIEWSLRVENDAMTISIAPQE